MKDPHCHRMDYGSFPPSTLINTSASRTPSGLIQVNIAIAHTYTHDALAVFQMHAKDEPK